MKKILINYNFIPDKEWIGNDYLIYDRSDSKDYLKDFDPAKIIYTRNIGQVDYDKLSYLIDNYDNLPDVFFWGKTNLFKYITREEYEKVKDNNFFTPLLTQNHKTYSDNKGVVCFYEDGMYCERNDSWYVHSLDKGIESYSQFCDYLGVFPIPGFIPFAPGGNYILTKETVHRYPKAFYEKMRQFLPFSINPPEAHMCERIYYTLWR